MVIKMAVNIINSDKLHRSYDLYFGVTFWGDPGYRVRVPWVPIWCYKNIKTINLIKEIGDWLCQYSLTTNCI